MSDIPSWLFIGAQIVCTKRERWVLVWGTDNGPDPVYGEVVTVRDIDTFDDFVMLSLVGYQDRYDHRRFRPLISQADDLEAHFAKLLLLDAPLNHEREEA